MAETNEQPKVRKANNGAPARSLGGAVEMYRRGMTMTGIAMALGFESTCWPGRPTANGMKRVGRLLHAAGVKK